jgi:hypothetical protein
MATSTSNNDHGHLVTRTDPCNPGTVPTWNNEGFLAWDPQAKLSPPGLSVLGDSMTAGSVVQLLTDLVIGDGQDGCGFESQNEAWYRFLVDPTPYNTIALNGQNVVTNGLDQTLLTQRGDFMRSDSLLAIIDVTDETDTSIKESSFYPLFAQELENGQPFHLPTARSDCTTKGPLDPCCASCGESAPAGCTTPDPGCAAASVYTDQTENLAIRAFGLSGGLMSHKARYGIEFFYQPSRYIQALTSPTVQDATGNTVPNPIFSVNSNAPEAAVRDPTLVFYAAITGVPWQLIARQDANGTPDLINGVSTVDPTQVGGFKNYEELNKLDPTGKNTFWDDIVGDPENYVPPISPFMQESTVVRSGTDPITGVSIAPPSTPNSDRTAFNGHEWNIPQPPGDIEYACEFDLPMPRDCSQPGAVCDCTGMASEDNPLCDPNPNDNMNPTQQSRAKAYPGVKNLAIAKGMMDQGIAASICAKQVNTPTNADGTPAADYGYRPAVNAIIARLKQAIKGQCLSLTLTPDPKTGAVPCVIIEASKSNNCNCAGNGVGPVPAAQEAAVAAAKQNTLYKTEQWNCFCEITQTSGPALTDCQTNQTVGMNTNGWCYIDDSGAEQIGNPVLIKNCPSTEKRDVRFVGGGQPASGSTVFITCEGT